MENINDNMKQKSEQKTSTTVNPELADSVVVGDVIALVTKGNGENLRNVLPRLCDYMGGTACATECTLAPEIREDLDESNWSCAQQNLDNVINQLGINPGDLYLGAVVGGTEVVFIDEHTQNESMTAFPKTDGVFGYEDSVKACRLADCGLVVVHGKDKNGRSFSGFIHATRNNMNGDDQFELDGQPVGGVEKMLREVVEHYEPSEISIDLVAGIRKDLYTFSFEPSEKELEDNPSDTAEAKRERLFKGWFEAGWITKHLDENGHWDGKSWDLDMYSAVRHQVEQAGLGDVYDDSQAIVDGTPGIGHASNRLGKLGKMREARDLYVVKPKKYAR